MSVTQSNHRNRTLKAHATGDFWRGKVKPSIRLQGQWLMRAGFIPGAFVTVEVRDGELVIRPINNTAPQRSGAGEQ